MTLLGLMPRIQLEAVIKAHLEKYNDIDKPKKENIITRKLNKYTLSFAKDDTDVSVNIFKSDFLFKTFSYCN